MWEYANKTTPGLITAREKTSEFTRVLPCAWNAKHESARISYEDSLEIAARRRSHGPGTWRAQYDGRFK